MVRRDMIRFNYLRDALPNPLERMRPSRIPEPLRTPLAALATAMIVVMIWWMIEGMLLDQARAEIKMEAFRLDASRAALAEAQIRRTHLETMFALDARLRVIRRSGAELSRRLADIANHVPAQAWLTSLTRVDGGTEIDGRVEGLDGLGEIVADLMSSVTASSPKLVRASREDRNRDDAIVAFDVRVGDRQ
jgi:hypothetical protein